MPPRAPQAVSATERRRVLQWVATIQGCSEVLCAAIDSQAQPDQQPEAAPADVRSSLMHAVQHFESFHGPSDSLFLSPTEEGEELPWLQHGAAQLRQSCRALQRAVHRAQRHRVLQAT